MLGRYLGLADSQPLDLGAMRRAQAGSDGLLHYACASASVPMEASTMSLATAAG